MIESRAIVISVEGKEALVESMQGGGCGHCDSENGCGSRKVSQLFCSEPRRFLVRNDGNAQAGTFVQVTLPEGVLIRSALLMYMLPLILMLCGAIVGALWDESSDAYAAAGSLIGLVSGFVLVKILSLRRPLASIAQPVILSPTGTESE